MAEQDRRRRRIRNHTSFNDRQIESLMREEAYCVVGYGTGSSEATPRVQLIISELDHLQWTDSGSPDGIADYLGWDDAEPVLRAIGEGQLYAIELFDLTRLPWWQFHDSAPGKILPGLPRVLEVSDPRWSPGILQGFMTSPQKALGDDLRWTPTDWLLDGRDVEAIAALITNRTWGRR